MEIKAKLISLIILTLREILDCPIISYNILLEKLQALIVRLPPIRKEESRKAQKQLKAVHATWVGTSGLLLGGNQSISKEPCAMEGTGGHPMFPQERKRIMMIIWDGIFIYILLIDILY